jgi:uncharacterized membrane protein YqaE (UPF0057 family)
MDPLSLERMAGTFPPLAVWICGSRRQLMVNLALTALFWIPGYIHARRVVDDYVNDRPKAGWTIRQQAEQLGSGLSDRGGHGP